RAPAVEVHANRVFAAAHDLVRALLRFVADADALAADLDLADGHVELARVDVDAGVTDGGEDAPPVGIGAEEGRLAQRRRADAARDEGGGLGVLGARDLDGDDVGGAFAVAHDLPRQLVEDVVHRLAEQLALVAAV